LRLVGEHGHRGFHLIAGERCGEHGRDLSRAGERNDAGASFVLPSRCRALAAIWNSQRQPGSFEGCLPWINGGSHQPSNSELILIKLCSEFRERVVG
jgi:hypothetical protein